MQAQSPEKHAAAILKSDGFEEIRVLRQGAEVVCTIERGLNRSPDADFRQALAVLKRAYPNNSLFRIILLEQGQAVYSLTVDANDSGSVSADSIRLDNQQQNVEIGYADLNFFKKIKKEAVCRPVHSGVTLVVYPQVTLQNMHFVQIYEKQFNLAPALFYSAWQGMLLTGQLIFPILNELNYRDNFIRPGFVTFSQTFRLPHLTQLKFTAGNFNGDRYGLDLKWKKQFENSRWKLSANMGLTGRSLVYDRYWNHTPLNKLNWNLKASYFHPFYQLQADLLVGQFIAGDKGFRLDIFRHFGETTIGFYATYTGYAPNGGFHIAVPLDPFKRRHQKQVRIMLPAYFGMEYNAMNEFVYNRYYQSSPDENRSEQDLYPQYINYQFHNLKIPK